MPSAPFFTQESVHLLAGLRKNNDREWFQRNKSRIDDFLIAPARQLVLDVGRNLGQMAEGLVADPRLDRSIYRLHRDTRFSKDKRPYKEHLGLIWWQDLPEGKLSSPCFYFHLTPDGFLWSAGCYRFTPPLLAAFRRAMVDPESGPAFKFIAAGLRSRGLEFNPPDLKRNPPGFSGPPWSGEWLRRKGVYTWSDWLPISDSTILGPRAAGYLSRSFADALPIHIWLKSLFERHGRQGEEGGQGAGPSPGGGRPAGKVSLPEDDF